MFICKNPTCSRSYSSHEGRFVVDIVRTMRAAHDEDREQGAVVIDVLRQRATRIYQLGEPPCAECGGLNLAFHTGPDEPQEVNILLENAALLQHIYGVLPPLAD
jgi:hypothetical protein